MAIRNRFDVQEPAYGQDDKGTVCRENGSTALAEDVEKDKGDVGDGPFRVEKSELAAQLRWRRGAQKGEPVSLRRTKQLVVALTWKVGVSTIDCRQAKRVTLSEITPSSGVCARSRSCTKSHRSRPRLPDRILFFF